MKIAKKHRGDFGYIRHIKSYNIRIALGLLVGCLAIYLVGFLFFDDLAPFFTIVSVLMILPTAQFMSKYFSFLRYASVTKEQFEAIESMCDNFLVLGELPVIRGKKNYMLLMTVISSAGIHILTDGKNDMDTKSAVESIIRPKGYQEPVFVYSDYVIYEMKLRTDVKSKSHGTDMTHAAKIAQQLILKTH